MTGPRYSFRVARIILNLFEYLMNFLEVQKYFHGILCFVPMANFGLSYLRISLVNTLPGRFEAKLASGYFDEA